MNATETIPAAQYLRMSTGLIAFDYLTCRKIHWVSRPTSAEDQPTSCEASFHRYRDWSCSRGWPSSRLV